MTKNRRKLLIGVCLLYAGFCFLKAAPGLLNSDGPPPSFASSDPFGRMSAPGPNGSVFSEGRRLATRPIQELRVGMRVVGRSPLAEDADRGLPEPHTGAWRLVRVRMEHERGKFVDAELLRPVEWLEEEGAEPGETIWLELPEMFLEGEAEILAIEPCPPLEPGRHPLITGTYCHVAQRVIELHAAGLAEPLICTPQHPFWSARRAEFVPADHLEVGELVLTISGESARITSLVPRTGPETVYGLEVYGEHVYHVGSVGLLTHNASQRTGARYSPGVASGGERLKHVSEGAT